MMHVYIYICIGHKFRSVAETSTAVQIKVRPSDKVLGGLGKMPETR